MRQAYVEGGVLEGYGLKLRMDRNRPGERFYVAYSVFGHVIPGASIEPYFMARAGMRAWAFRWSPDRKSVV